MKQILHVTIGLLMLGACQTLPTSAEYVARGDGFFKDGKHAQAIAAYNRALVLSVFTIFKKPVPAGHILCRSGQGLARP